MNSNVDIDSMSKEIAKLLIDISSAQTEKNKLQLKMEELNLEMSKAKDEYNIMEDKIRSAKHQITEFCVQQPLKMVK